MSFKGPNFSIEKPLPISEDSNIVKIADNNNEYISQLKLDEHRSFFIFDDKIVTVLGWRGNVHHTIKLEESLGNFILDGGIIKTKNFKTKPLYYVFDTLVVDGKKLRNVGYMDRYNMINGLIKGDSRFVIPENIKGVSKEFERLKNKKSKLLKDFCTKNKIDLKTGYEICEGFVIKKVDGKLKYPKNLHKNSNQFKLKLKGK